MIIQQKITIKLNTRHIHHFTSLGYKNLKPNQFLEIKILELPAKSNLKIPAVCDNCKSQNQVKYQDYNKFTNSNIEKYFCKNCNYIKIQKTCLEKYGLENAIGSLQVREKIKKTFLEKYGVENIFDSIVVKDRCKKTLIERYGNENPFQSEILKEKIKINKRTSMENSNKWIPISEISEFNIYKNKVRSLTKINIKNMKWDGLDFYDGEYIMDNFSYHHLNNNYPTIDHKISIFKGFIDNKSPEEISNISNLCWTKRIINITKNRN